MTSIRASISDRAAAVASHAGLALVCRRHAAGRRPAFTLMELLVVMAIIVILASMAVPAIRSLSKNNDDSQAANLVRGAISQSRSIAISQHRMAGVVFFEETKTYSSPVNAARTAVQIIVEDFNQAQWNPASGVTVFVQYSTQRQYLPGGVRLATLNDNAMGSGNVAAGDLAPTSTAPRARVVLFDATGQVIMRDGLATPSPGNGGSNQGQYLSTNSTNGVFHPAFGDWQFLTPAGAAPGGAIAPYTNATSAPAFFLYNQNDLKAANVTTDAAVAKWIQGNASVILVNGNTGTVIIDKRQ